jgi:cellulose synthase/poly-beta-1,6-N-acetylglucosamine synthase-like glycosyltransferase
MTMFLELVCWVSAGVVLYSYGVYPLLIGLTARLWPRRPIAVPLDERVEWPFVSLVIAAYREERVIRERIENALAMDYPADRLEVLVGVDGDLDRTGEIIREYTDPRIRLVQFPQRRGKPSVLNDCLTQTRGAIVAFSDANTFWQPDALRRLVIHFDEPRVGGVCGQLLLTDPVTGENVDGLYWKYENYLKRCEGRCGALLGANGAIYAIRRELWSEIPASTIVDDFLIGMRIHLAGRCLDFEELAVAHEESAPHLKAEFQRRARIGAGGFQSLGWLLPLLSPSRGVVAWAFWSHKVLRWLCPVFLVALLVANLGLLNLPGYGWLLLGQIGFYLLALLGNYWPGRSLPSRCLRLTTMFTSMNLALLAGLWRWLRNAQSGAWQRTARTAELRS